MVSSRAQHAPTASLPRFPPQPPVRAWPAPVRHSHQTEHRQGNDDHAGHDQEHAENETDEVQPGESSPTPDAGAEQTNEPDDQDNQPEQPNEPGRVVIELPFPDHESRDEEKLSQQNDPCRRRHQINGTAKTTPPAPGRGIADHLVAIRTEQTDRRDGLAAVGTGNGWTVVLPRCSRRRSFRGNARAGRGRTRRIGDALPGRAFLALAALVLEDNEPWPKARMAMGTIIHLSSGW